MPIFDIKYKYVLEGEMRAALMTGSPEEVGLALEDYLDVPAGGSLSVEEVVEQEV